MIRLLIILTLAAIAIVIGPIVTGHKGYVLIAMGQWTIEMTVVSLALSLLGLFTGFVLVGFLFGKILRLSNRSVLWISNRQQRKALQQTSDGMLALASHDWRNAEKLLTRSAANSYTPALNYLVAAEAAKQQGRLKHSQQYVEKVGNAATSSLAIAITKARLADDPDAQKQALNELQQWRNKQPQHAPLLMQLSHLYQALEQWQDWLNLLPALKKYTHIDPQELQRLQQKTYGAYFQQLAEQQGVDSACQYWQQLPKDMHRDPTLLARLSAAMRQQGGGSAISEIVFEWLCKSLDQELLNEWALLPASQPEEKLLQVKKLKRKDSSDYYSFVGLTALHAKRYEDAAHYLRQALNVQSHQRDQLALANALENLGRYDQAIQLYKSVIR